MNSHRWLSRLPWWIQGPSIGLIAAALQWTIIPLIGGYTPFLFFYPALLVTALLLGQPQALVVLFLGAINAVAITALSAGASITLAQGVVALLLFMSVGAAVIVFSARFRRTQQRVTAAEQRLAVAQEHTGVGFFELDFQTGRAYVSPSMSQMLGQPVISGSISLERWLKSLHQDHWADTERALQDRLSKGENRYEREQRIPLANGESIWVLNRIHLDSTPAGQLIRARGAAVDVTERKKADTALKLAQQQVRQQLEDLQRLHAFSQTLVTSDSGLPVAMKELLDVLIELYGATHCVVSLIKPHDGGFEPTVYSGFSADDVRAPQFPPEANSPNGVEADLYAAIVRSHEHLAATQALQGIHNIPLIGSSGTAIGAISVMFNDARQQTDRERKLCETCATTAAALVEREWARAKAAETEYRFTIALESSNVSFSILSPVRNERGAIIDFEWTYLNQAACRAIGLQRQDLVGRRIKEVLPTAWDPPGHFDQYRRCVEHNEPAQFEFHTDAAMRGIRWYSVVTSPLQGSLAVWFANITDRKLYEQSLEAADRRKDEFLTTLAHELRSPLAAIRQGASIVGSAQASDLQKRRGIAVIERQVQHMSLLLDDLLDVARIGRGTLLLRKSKEPLKEIIETAIETARPHIDAKRHHFFVEQPEQQLFVEVDPLRIAQVVANLLINASKYTEMGGEISLTVTVDENALRICIKDSGIGLTTEQLNQVFNLYSQVASALEKSEGGLGVGLALARGIVSLHDGSLTAQSAGLGCGSEFSIQLPRSCVSAEVGMVLRRIGAPMDPSS